MHSTPRSAGPRQKKKPSPRNKKLTNAAIIGAVILLVVGLSAAFVRTEQTQARSAAAAEMYVAPPTEDRPVVAFLGDSFTAGTGAGSKSERWNSLLAAPKGWQKLNYGSAGTNYGTDGPTSTAQSYAERLTSLTMSAPDIVIVSSAGNSMNQDQQNGITSTFETLLEKLPDAQILATSPYTRSGVFPAHLESFGDQIREAVESVNGQYLDIDQPLGDHPDVMSDDGVHPNAEGYRLIADAVEAEL